MESKYNNKTVGLAVVSTGQYHKEFFPKFWDTFKKRFCRGSAKLYIFTDSEVPNDERIIKIPIKHFDWPKMPLLRWELYSKYIDLFQEYYIFSIDADTYFEEDILLSHIKGDRVATLHRNIKRERKDFNYETRKESTAYVSEDEGENYYIAGFCGGNREQFIKMVMAMTKSIRADIDKGIRAVWGDESHINRYFIDHTPTMVLTPEYMCPEGNKTFRGRIIHAYKDFKAVNLPDAKDNDTVNPKEYKNVVFAKYRILITGHKGYIGSKLFLKLKDCHNVFGVDLKDNKDILLSDLPEVDIIYHLAGQVDVQNSIKDPLFDARNNILTMVKLIKRYPKAKIIYTSSAASIDPKSPYGLSKKTAGEYLKMLHNNFVVCYLPNIYGGGKKKGVVKRFIEDEKPKLFGGNQTRTFIHLFDIINALDLSKEWKAGEYFLGNGNDISLLDLINATGKEYTKWPALKGEIERSRMENNTPNWEPYINIFDYIRKKCCVRNSL